MLTPTTTRDWVALIVITSLGIAVVAGCLLLYGGWMEWSVSRPIRPAPRRKRE
jgi:hypothetical protein